MKVIGLTQLSGIYPGLRVLFGKLCDNAQDILESIEIKEHKLILVSKIGQKLILATSGYIYRVTAMSDVEFIKTRPNIQCSELRSEILASMNKVEKFLAINRIILSAINDGRNYDLERLIMDKKVALKHFRRKRGQAGWTINVDGFEVQTGIMTLDHYFKPDIRKTYNHNASHQSRYLGPLKPNRAIMRVLMNYIIGGGTLTKYTYWHALGKPYYRIMPLEIIRILRKHLREIKLRHSRNIIIHDYSQKLSVIMETTAHLLNMDYKSMNGHVPKLAIVNRPDGHVIRMIAPHDVSEIEDALKQQPDDLVICTMSKRAAIDKIISLGDYSASGIDLYGAKNYTYARRRAEPKYM